MPESGLRAADGHADRGEGLQAGIVSDAPEGEDDDTPPLSLCWVDEILEFAVEKRTTAVEFLPRGLVCGRSAPERGRYVGSVKPQAVAAVLGVCPVGPACAVQGPIQPQAATVSGEHAAGPIGPMCCRRQTDDHEASARIAEAGHGAAPILLIAEGAALDGGDVLAMGDETGAAPAADDLGCDFVEQLLAW